VFKAEGCSSGVAIGIHNNSLNNLRRGLMERVFFVERDGQLVPPPRPLAGVLTVRLHPFRVRLARTLPKLTPWTSDQFVGTYGGQRKMTYERAAETLRSRPLEERDAELKTFIKAEKVNFTDKPDPAPRVIQPRDARYILETGRFLKQAEKPLFRAIDRVFGGPTVMKGLTPYGVAGELRQMWEEFKDPVGVGLDASRFDQHVSEYALQWEHAIYALMFQGRDREYLRRILRWQIANKGVARASDGVIRYRVNGCRGSGDINTSMGNCLLMCAMVFAFAQHVQLRCRLANNGDDCVLIFERDDLYKLETLRDWFLECGFTMKVEAPAYEFERIEFCQCRPVLTPQGWIMVRAPRVALAKDSTTLLDARHHAASWFDAVGKGGAAIAGGIPLYNSFYGALIRNSGVPGKLKVHEDRWYSSTGFYHMQKGMSRGLGPVAPTTRYSFWRAFGILPDAQEALESILDQWGCRMTVDECPQGHSLPQLFDDLS
jgi:hypothetical protein